MTLEVETGAGLVNAESYASVADADAYFAARGITAWTGSGNAKEQALRKGTQWLDDRFAYLWLGFKGTNEQALRWPRYDVVTMDGFVLSSTAIPQALKNACCEAALLSLTGQPLFVAETGGSGSLAAERIKIGELEIDEKFNGEKSAQPTYPLIVAMLSDLISGGSSVERS